MKVIWLVASSLAQLIAHPGNTAHYRQITYQLLFNPLAALRQEHIR
jgi:hypothetical protein